MANAGATPTGAGADGGRTICGGQTFQELAVTGIADIAGGITGGIALRALEIDSTKILKTLKKTKINKQVLTHSSGS